MARVSVYEKHKWQIELYELAAGRDAGRLLFAMAILSDIEEMLFHGTRRSQIREEIKEAKELIADVISALGKVE